MTEEKYEVKRCVEEAAIIVTSDKEPKTTCTVTLTSPIMREASAEGGKYGKNKVTLVSLHSVAIKLLEIFAFGGCAKFQNSEMIVKNDSNGKILLEWYVTKIERVRSEKEQKA